MVDIFGKWTPEKDYDNYPTYKLCDMDRIANLIIKQGYTPKTSLKNLSEMLAIHFSDACNEDSVFFGLEYDEDGMVYNLSALNTYIEASGGLKEFDYEM